MIAKMLVLTWEHLPGTVSRCQLLWIVLKFHRFAGMSFMLSRRDIAIFTKTGVQRCFVFCSWTRLTNTRINHIRERSFLPEVFSWELKSTVLKPKFLLLKTQNGKILFLFFKRNSLLPFHLFRNKTSVFFWSYFSLLFRNQREQLFLINLFN